MSGCLTTIVIGIALIGLIVWALPDDADNGGATASPTRSSSVGTAERYIPDLEACQRYTFLKRTARAVAVERHYAPLPTGDDDPDPDAHMHLAHGHLGAGHAAAWRNPVGTDWRCHLRLAAESYDRAVAILAAEGNDAGRKLFGDYADDYRDEAEADAAPERWTSQPPPDLAETDAAPAASPDPQPSACDAAGARLAADARDVAALGGVEIGDWSRDHLAAANAHLLAARSAAATGGDDWRCHLHRAADRYERHAEGLRDRQPQIAGEFAANAIQLRSLAGAADWSAASAVLDDGDAFDPIGMAGDADATAEAPTPDIPTCDDDTLTAAAQHAYVRDALTPTDWSSDHYAVLYGHLSAARDDGDAGGDDWRCHLRMIARRYYDVGDRLLDIGDDGSASYYIGIADTTFELADAERWSDVSAILHAMGGAP